MLQIKNIEKKYKTGTLIQQALNDVSLNLRDNEFVCILGPSGSGKTTLLNIIGGLDRYDKGDLIINGISTKNYKDKDWDSYRNHTIGFIFQSYNLISHQTILANVELALSISGVSKNKRKKLALDALESVGLKEHAHKKPNQLSGGQMQRVAIARALINNPDIILADEPTGALDSDTSVQVMELLKKVAKDRLVVMVTHNPELAKLYATRIVNLKDGVIKSDTDPFEIKTKKEKKLKTHNMGKTSMSFKTSLQLSFNNLKTKKGRTLLTSFAGSIGIIGIALILSLSNGVNKYIHSIEEDTLSTYPLQIRSTGFDMTSMMGISSDNNDTTQNNEDNIKVTKAITNMFSTIGTNDLKSLKEYIENGDNEIKTNAKTIEYLYNVTPLIFNNDTKNLRQVNPDISFSTLGMGSSTSTNSMMSSMMSTDVFYEMPKDTNLYENQYDIKAGSWPKNYNEIVLVLTEDGNISDFLLYTLGLRDYKELDKMINQFINEEDVDVKEYNDTYLYSDILNKTFKLVQNSDCYEYDKTYKVWKNKIDNTKYMKEVVKKGEDLKIVGIVSPKKDANSTMLSPGLGYTPLLTEYLIDNAKESKIVKEQLKNPNINVFTGKKFDNDKKSDFDMNSLVKVDESKMKDAFKIDESKIKIDFEDLSDILNTNFLPTLELNEILNEINFTLAPSDANALINELIQGFDEYMASTAESNQINEQFKNYLNSSDAKAIITNGIASNSSIQEIFLELIKDFGNRYGSDITIDLEKYLIDYLSSNQAQEIIKKNINKIILNNNLDKQITNVVNKYFQKVMKYASVSLEKELQKSFGKLSESLMNAFTFDEKAFASAFKINKNEEDLSEVFASMLSKEATTYENNLKKLNYAKLDEPSGINIYPKDFEGNKKITEGLKNYNNLKKENNEEDKVISYTDMVGTLMSSVTTIINVISYVLIAFVSISLIVSSIMIGVITYISVLERKKEIGILRAIGASKKNVSQVFNAETFIIGLLSGIIGISITLLLLIPINKIIAIIANNASVKAILPFTASIVLIILSTILTLIGGIIPSKKAAKEDPVLALRSE